MDETEEDIYNMETTGVDYSPTDYSPKVNHRIPTAENRQYQTKTMKKYKILCTYQE